MGATEAEAKSKVLWILAGVAAIPVVVGLIVLTGGKTGAVAGLGRGGYRAKSRCPGVATGARRVRGKSGAACSAYAQKVHTRLGASCAQVAYRRCRRKTR